MIDYSIGPPSRMPIFLRPQKVKTSTTYRGAKKGVFDWKATPNGNAVTKRLTTRMMNDSGIK